MGTKQRAIVDSGYSRIGQGIKKHEGLMIKDIYLVKSRDRRIGADRRIVHKG